MSKTTLTLAILATGLLALGGLATTVAADDSDSPRSKAQERREDAREHRSELREDREDHDGNRSAERQERQDRMRAAHDAWQECKREAVADNASVPESCGDEKAYFLNATHARREGRALHGAIAALERQIGRLEAREIALEAKLASGNFTGNQTAESVQAAIEKIDAAQERLAAKLEALKARLDALHGKWQSVRDEVQDRRHGDDDEDEEEDEDDSSSSSSSASASESASSSSSSSTSASP